MGGGEDVHLGDDRSSAELPVPVEHGGHERELVDGGDLTVDDAKGVVEAIALTASLGEEDTY